jgi:LacI family transcriptional regulator
MGPQNTSTSRDREIGLRAALQHAPDARYLPELRRTGTYSHQNGYQSALDLLSLPAAPTAIACANDVIAFGALDAAAQLGLEVPRELTVLGFDDMPMAGWRAFDLTTVRQPFDEMARAAARLLLDRIHGAGVSEPRREVFPASLVKRGTAAPPSPVGRRR